MKERKGEEKMYCKVRIMVVLISDTKHCPPDHAQQTSDCFRIHVYCLSSLLRFLIVFILGYGASLEYNTNEDFTDEEIN